MLDSINLTHARSPSESYLATNVPSRSSRTAEPLGLKSTCVLTTKNTLLFTVPETRTPPAGSTAMATPTTDGGATPGTSPSSVTTRSQTNDPVEPNLAMWSFLNGLSSESTCVLDPVT